MIWLCSLLWNVFIVAGTVYLIVCHNWSPWWMALALGLLASPKVGSKE